MSGILYDDDINSFFNFWVNKKVEKEENDDDDND